MSRYTSIGVAIWDWAPLMELDDPWAFRLWFALLTTPEAKRCPPGLWHGGPATMAEAAKMGSGDVIAALRVLRDRRLVEYDERSRVARLVVLPPDKPEGTRSGSVVQSWWTRFGAIPACSTRDAHVPLLRWLSDQTSADVQRAWARTFGTLPTPLPGPRGLGTRREGVGEGPGEGQGQGGHQGPREGVGEGPPGFQSSLFPSGSFSNSGGEGVRHPLGEGPEEEEVIGRERGESERGGSGELEVDPEFARTFGDSLVGKLRAGFRPAPAVAAHHGQDLARRRS